MTERTITPDRKPLDRAITTVLWDLDGTLVDSIELIVQSYQHTARHHLGRTLPRAEILKQIGRPLSVCLEELAPGNGERLRQTYRAFQQANHHRLLKAMPGIADVVAELHRRGFRQGIVTSRSRETSLEVLRLLGLDRLLEPTVCVDDTARHKPDPAPILLALARLDVPAARALYVGDSVHDIRAGNQAGVRTAAALWGAGDRASLLAAGPDLVLTSPVDLLAHCPAPASPAG